MISDIHVGDPQSPALEDFDRDADFARLLLEEIPARTRGDATLIIGGDFIDFPQILPVLGKNSPHALYGTTEEESVARVRRAIEGHHLVFSALRTFLDRGNQVLLLPGNHDIDLHFPGVLEEIQAAVGASQSTDFAFVPEGFLREKRVYIEHGNQYAFDNRFDHWESPILEAPDGKRRIERPWGTLFMDETYNEIEEAYPFVNRIFPHGALAKVLLYQDTKTALPKLALLVKFFMTKGKRYLIEQMLGAGPEEADEPMTRQAIEQFVGGLEKLSHEEKRALVEEVARDTGAAEEHEEPAAGMQFAPGLLGRTDENGLEQRAQEVLRSGTVDIVAFGHTHKPEARPLFFGGRACSIFNTGGWIPVLEILPHALPSLAELRAASPVHELRYLVLDFDSGPVGSLERLKTT
ncbi:metallophosphoesterase [Chondromyces apiculatus]|uniref:Calcineurin-like phosphoesterase domain-containing protein n=1 Tax=Chondromyces apiculatus DSM 436 TaxID=1192034 RepID=A0A017THF6_9BACT|nr:metallophosphoesterase [Chondromyces apiculatus]EYF08674.1 Hypothetical protein CAP_2535 [Chondromyces apiculatus DSM 436]